MHRPNLTIFAANGRESFTSQQITRLESHAEVCWITAMEKVTPERFVELLATSDFAAITPRVTPLLDMPIIAQLSRLKGIAIPTTGHEWLNVAALLSAGITVSNLPDFSTISCAEFTWGLIFNLTRHIGEAANRIKAADFTTGGLRGIELHGRTLGVVGMGCVGSRVAAMGSQLGMRVLGHDLHPISPAVAESTPFLELLAQSDIVSLHLPLTAQTRELINDKSVQHLKPGAFLVNTARPHLVDPTALAPLLHSGQLAGYAFDLGYEPISTYAEIIDLPGVMALPHISWYTAEAVTRETEGWVNNIISLVNGKPRNCLQQ
jgi:phosphoglycerate dehydrogenase-like enzyme